MTLLLLLGSTGLIFILAGFILYKYPPKEINSLYGYRTANSMSNRQRWDFSQTYSGKLMMKYGAIMMILAVVGFFIPLPEFVQLSLGIIILILVCVFLFLKTEKELNERFGKSQKS